MSTLRLIQNNKESHSDRLNIVQNDAEQAILGALLIDNRILGRLGPLNQTHFHKESHQRIFSTCRDLISSGRLADPTTLASRLPGDIEGGTPDYLVLLTREAAIAIGAIEYANLIRELTVRRGLIALGEELVQECYDPGITLAPAQQIERIEDKLARLKVGNADNARRLVISSKEFVAGFVAPDYLVDGLLQESFLYSLTGATGAGKTAITLRLAASVALGTVFANRETKKRRVLYLAAENPVDVRMRWIALAQQMDFDPDTVDVFFVEGAFKISQMGERLKKEATVVGGEFGLVIIDTGPVFYEGDNENDRTQQAKHAAMLRDLIDIIPGQPAVIANVHPVKNAAADNLLPAGGGSFLNQVDGNLTAAKTDNTTELHWQGKFRGVEFAPMHFMLKTVTHERLKDRRGRLIPTVISDWISERAKEEISNQKVRDEDKLLATINANPKATLSALATAMGWKLFGGEPNKMKVGRCIKSLMNAKLVTKTRAGYYQLTDGGLVVLGGGK
jgi:hypothetical protein